MRLRFITLWSLAARSASGHNRSAQVNGRNNLSYKEKFSLDVWYVDHNQCGWTSEFSARPVRTVLGGEGVSALHMSARQKSFVRRKLRAILPRQVKRFVMNRGMNISLGTRIESDEGRKSVTRSKRRKRGAEV